MFLRKKLLLSKISGNAEQKEDSKAAVRRCSLKNMFLRKKFKNTFFTEHIRATAFAFPYSQIRLLNNIIPQLFEAKFRQQISLLILNEFKQINKMLFHRS